MWNGFDPDPFFVMVGCKVGKKLSLTNKISLSFEEAAKDKRVKMDWC